MPIARIECHPVRVPLKPERRMISALGRHEVSDYLLVRVWDDQGAYGVGEATVMPRWSGETVWSARALVERVLAPVLVGLDPLDIPTIARRMDEMAAYNHFTKAAIEMACWDLNGRVAGRPVYELLGGPRRPLEFRCRFSIGAYEPARVRRVAAERVAAGFTTLKVKVGGHPPDDIERVRAVRAEVGPDIELMVDANGGWDAQTAIDALATLADCRLALVEQPTPPGDYAALARVRRESGLPLLADEACFDLAQARELIRNEACDVISVYPGKNGGLGRAREIVELAAAHGVACSIGSNLEWDVATAAMGHLVVACENLAVERYPGDALGPTYHEFSVARQPLAITGPLVSIRDEPGLGIEIDWDVVADNACDA